MMGTAWVLVAGLAVLAVTIVAIAHLALRGSDPAERERLLRALSTVFRALADVVRAWRDRR
ncbi:MULTISPECIES: hypothetical protein [unclassified Streptomyces]|jgi:methionine-rich copper-binding protein CopC|uniref:hypothetical protein n=1 Tax=unclassified Streptomyces TaxID=2593676 RepID=UPI00235B4A2D|nr:MULTISPECIES: hypothetical protein [unclassified Streptomyces]MDH6502513.1 methionine-rich copper-binding protein CopC [Streptomyces sp. SAI-149]GLP66455.1 hypothetical protein TUSST3_30750 [Streptomyces sp. TUS-ST3]